MVITEWALEDRPREKMMANGEESLTDTELLAILINSGSQGRSAVDVAREVLQECHGDLDMLHLRLNPNYTPDAKDGRKLLKGIGPAKSCTIRAALELGRRMGRQQDIKRTQNLPVESSERIAAQFSEQLSHIDHEELWGLYMAKNGNILARVQIGVGGADAAAADVKKIVQPAILHMATNVALCHNHPHSAPRPSRADIELTHTAQKALAMFGVRLLDHVIIADGSFYSMNDHGDL